MKNFIIFLLIVVSVCLALGLVDWENDTDEQIGQDITQGFVSTVAIFKQVSDFTKGVVFAIGDAVSTVSDWVDTALRWLGIKQDENVPSEGGMKIEYAL